MTGMTVKDGCRGRWAMKRRRFAKKLVDNLDIREICIKTAAADGRQLWCFGLMDTYVAGRSFGLEFKGLLLVELGQVFVGFLEVSEGCGHVNIVEKGSWNLGELWLDFQQSNYQGELLMSVDLGTSMSHENITSLNRRIQVVWNKNSTEFTVLQ